MLILTFILTVIDFTLTLNFFSMSMSHAIFRIE